MLEEIIKQYGDQLLDTIEVILFIAIVISLFMNGPIGTIISNISNGLC